MSQFLIKKTKREVVLHVAGHKPIKGNVFLSEVTTAHHGAERVLDVLAAPEPFIAFETEKKDFWMVQKKAIEKIVVDAEYELEIMRSYGAGVAKLKDVLVVMTDGKEELGVVWVESQEPWRAFDEVNRSKNFLLLDCGKSVQLIGFASIATIKEPP